jgi:hypothetical protein
MITLWSGSIASIPSGFALCDGTSGTPDLRDKFIVGAGSTYAVDATGGSADATLPTHTHTNTVTDPGHFHSYYRARQTYSPQYSLESNTPCFVANSSTATDINPNNRY